MMTSSPRPTPRAFRMAHMAIRPRRKWTPFAMDAAASAAGAALAAETGEQTLSSIEPPNAIADVVDVIVGQGHIHGQHQHPREQAVRVRQRLGEAEALQVVNGLAAPLDESSDSAVFQSLFEAVPAVGFDLVVLEDIEVVGVAIFDILD